MRIIINENLYIKCDRNQYTLVEKTLNKAKGIKEDKNVSYNVSISGALKAAFRYGALNTRVKKIEDLENYLKSEIDNFVSNLKIEDRESVDDIQEQG